MPKSKQAGHLPVILAVILVLAIAGVGWYVVKHHKKAAVSSAPAPTQSTASSPAAPTSGTDNASLNSDLNSVNSGLSQGDQDLQSTNSALSDQQNTISE